MVKAVVSGGTFDGSGEGVLWLVDFEAEVAHTLLRWQPPPHLRVPGKGFAGAALQGSTLYVAAHAAIVRVDMKRWVVDGVLHQPCWNDLHHVHAQGDRLYVVNTGLGSIDVLKGSGEFIGSHSLLPAWANHQRQQRGAVRGIPLPVRLSWDGAPPPPDGPAAPPGYFSPEGSALPFHQRKVVDPLHLNHVTFVGDRMLATCFADGTLRDLRTFEAVFSAPGAHLHDGVVDGTQLWLTAVDGTVFTLDTETFALRQRRAVFETGHHGWCRGLAVTPTHLLVGLTEVRPSRPSRHPWSRAPAEGSETSVLMVERSSGALVSRVDLSDRDRHSKLYSVLLIDEAPHVD